MVDKKAPPTGEAEDSAPRSGKGEGKEDEGSWARIPSATYGVKPGESGKTAWAVGDYRDQEGKSKEAKTEKEFEVGPVFQKEYKPGAWKTIGTEKPGEISESDKTYVAVLHRKASIELLSASFNPEEKKAKLTAVDAKAELSLVHAQAGGQWDPALVLKEFLLGKDAKPAASASPAATAPMAARLADLTGHLALPLAPGPGSPNVFIGGMPAWRAGLDVHLCAAPGGHGAGPTTPGASNVFINGFPAARVTDFVVEPFGGPDPIVIGCPTVLIGVATPPPAPPKKSLLERAVAGILDAASGWVLFEASAVGDLGKVTAEGKIFAEANLKEKKAGGELKGSLGAVSAAGSVPLKVRIKLPWRQLYVGIGLTIEGTGPGVGAEAGGDFKINDGKTFFHLGGGAKVSPGPAGLGLKASLDISKK
jgi:uncharacterized Zn-binding protein involved in type VI secretion